MKLWNLGKLFGWFWAINPCILVESSQLSIKGINSFAVKKNISGFSLSMHLEHSHRTSSDYGIIHSVFLWHHHAGSASTRHQISLHVRWLKRKKNNKDKQGDNKRNTKLKVFVSSPPKKNKVIHFYRQVGTLVTKHLISLGCQAMAMTWSRFAVTMAFQPIYSARL